LLAETEFILTDAEHPRHRRRRLHRQRGLPPLVGKGGYRVVNVDKLTYAGNLESLRDIVEGARLPLRPGDIATRRCDARLLRESRSTWIMHLAAESHVDRSIDGPGVFLETNVTGTFRC
jgi:dTDP-glucose 4,6-dehydratase